MKVEVCSDREFAKEVILKRAAAGGHCPCVLEALRNEDTLCMCKEFRDAPVGTTCHCGLYTKIES